MRCTASASPASSWPATRTRKTGSRALLSKDSAFNLPGRDVAFAHRTEELPRGTENNLTTKRASLGLEGSFENRFALLGLERQLHVQPQ